MRQNRIVGVPVPNRKEAAKNMQRGSIKTAYDNQNSITVWRDSQPVYVASNFAVVEPVGSCRRYCGQEKGYVEIPCPKSILDYNTTMGGIDNINQMTKCNRISIRGKKWYWPLYTWSLNLMMVQAWRLYRITMKQRHELARQKDVEMDRKFEAEVAVLPRFQKEARMKEAEERRKKERKEEKKLEEKSLLDFMRECVEMMLVKHSELNKQVPARESASRLSGSGAKEVRFDMSLGHLVVDSTIKGVCMQCKGRSFLRKIYFSHKE